MHANCLFVFISLLASSGATAASEQLWRGVLFDGSKIGQALSERITEGEHIRTRDLLKLEMRSDGKPVTLEVEVIFDELRDGTRLGFSNRLKTAETDTLTTGKVDGDFIEVNTRGVGVEYRQRVALPLKALFAEGQAQQLRASGLKPGAILEFEAFDPSLLAAVHVRTRVGERRSIELFERSAMLVAVSRTTSYPGRSVTSESFVDADLRALRESLPMLGKQLELIACDEACALAPSQPFDSLSRLLIASPYRVSRDALHQTLRFVLASRNGASLSVPETFEQHSHGLGPQVTVDVCLQCGKEPAPSAAELAEASMPNNWIQSDHPELQAMARRAGGVGSMPRQHMEAMTWFVRDHMHGRGEFFGYTTALEAARSGRGDCTAYALLLAALGRASGIPTRMAVGIAYADRYHDKRAQFVPHAWTQAWIDGRWVSFDAALESFDASHIALAVGQGDPARFVAGMGVLGNLQIKSAGMLSMQRPLAAQ
jgi:Transglutaminase-like superfamily